ncbi:MAG: hypothetical protein JSV19_08315 [Phycisphaerales bacterium]|nr:MAG: hypothetical protein JSV19_08315 [Phycisphaerales bacterium]
MRALKTCLWIAGVLCLLSVFGMFLPFSLLERLAKAFSDQAFPDAPVFLYMIRVASATYAAVGVFYVMLALRPMSFGPLVPFSGLAAVFVGVVCGMSGVLVGIPVLWFLGDSLCCTVLGVLIVVFWRKARSVAG